jgi:hypothetical protein
MREQDPARSARADPPHLHGRWRPEDAVNGMRICKLARCRWLEVRTGRLVHCFSARKYHFDEPFANRRLGSHVGILYLHSATKL